MKKIQDIIISVIFLLVLIAGGLTLFLLPQSKYSDAERRPLAVSPSFSADSVLKGNFFTETDDWVTDHFIGRETFRHLKAVWQLYCLREKENNGLAVVDNSIIKLEKQVNEESLEYAKDRFESVYNDCLANSNCNIFCAVIPDKSYFLKGKGYPVMDFDKMERMFGDSVPASTSISLKESLSLSDYYLTDSHWRQECIIPAAKKLLESMGRDGSALNIDDFDVNTYENFYGVYAGQSALDPAPDTITYLSGGPISETKVLDYSTMQVIQMYDPDGCDKRDPYTLFLGGSKGLLRIENPATCDERELIIFRDSFGSSISPLLAAGYRAVTLIDLRYVQPIYFKRYVRFNNNDVLFLFSATLLNNSQGLM